MACLKVVVSSFTSSFSPIISRVCTTLPLVISCFGGGYWDNSLKWYNDDGWINK